MPRNRLNINSENYKIYFEERKMLVENSIKSAELLAWTVLTLSAGSFGLSIAFVKDIVPHFRKYTSWLLIVSWLSYCITILATLVSVSYSQKAYHKQIEILEEVYFKTKERPSDNSYNSIIKKLNNVLIVTFVLGTFSLALFAIFNL